MDRIRKLRELAQKSHLDGILLYGNRSDPRYLQWATHHRPLLYSLVYVDDVDIVFFEIDYLMADVPNTYALGSIGIDEMSPHEGVLSHLQKKGIRNLGYGGAFPYSLLSPLEKEMESIHDVSADLDKELAHKSPEEIGGLTASAQHLASCFDAISKAICPGMTERDIASSMSQILYQKSDMLAFPVSVISSSRIYETTAGLATDALIQDSDVIVIDAGCIRDNQCSDATRMYFIGEQYASLKGQYEALKRAHHKVIQEIQSTTTVGQIEFLYRSALCDEKFCPHTIDTLAVADLGHSIGAFVHEAPMIYADEYKDWEFGKNSVFTLEPEILTENGRIRIEDMIHIDNGGTVNILTKTDRG